MAMKVNYGFQKAERQRAKQAKKDAKQREKDAGGGSTTDETVPEPAAEGVEPKPAEDAQ